MRRLIATIVIAMLIVSHARAGNRDLLLKDCDSVQSCLLALEPEVSEDDRGIYEDDIDAVRRILKTRFGDEAKYALLDKALTGHPGWRNFAGALLGDWGGWSEQDIPKLAKALELNSGGWIARALGEIGSSEAIDALVADLARAQYHSQTAWALRQSDPELVLPKLLAILESPEQSEEHRRWSPAQSVISDYRSDAAFVADDWIVQARSRQRGKSERIAALRGLEAINGYLGEKSKRLRPLLRARDEGISKQAFRTLVAALDPVVVDQLADDCKPTAKKWDEFAIESFECLIEIAGFGSNALLAGANMLPFLESENKLEQLYAIETLGRIGFQRATSDIESFLTSSDWRHVYAATRALGQLKARGSVVKIEQSTRNHWLWQVERFGELTSAALIRQQPYAVEYTSRINTFFQQRFGQYEYLFDFSRACQDGTWMHDGIPITFEEIEPKYMTVTELPDGKLVTTNKGEFGGGLSWQPNNGSETTLVDQPATHIFPTAGGYLTLHGLAHMMSSFGFAAWVERNDEGGWEAEEIVRFPKHPSKILRLNETDFAAKIDNLVLIFSSDGAVREANCKRKPQ